MRDKLRSGFTWEEWQVSFSGRLMPASEVSEADQPGRHRASGCGNMKFMLNGAITLGTWTAPMWRSPMLPAVTTEIIFGCAPHG